MHYSFKKIFLGIILFVVTPFSFGADQAPTPNQAQTSNTVISPQPPEIDAKAYILIDANSGEVLAQKNMNDRLAPASLTKLMTAYVISDALKQGQVKLGDLVTVSEKAWRMQGSRMFIQVGSQVNIKDLLDGIIVASGNDACVAAAEHIAGTEDAFVQLMNQNAARLGMQNTHYTDSTGMPDSSHYSTAYDLSLLTRAIIRDFPEDYAWYKKQWIVFNNVRQPNRNRLLWRDPTVDGLKTGHTDDAGFCLVASAVRNNMRLISVVLGTPSDYVRTVDTQALLNWGYRFFETHKLFNAEQTLENKMQPRVWFGKNKYGKLGFDKDAYVTIPINQMSKLQANIVVQQKLQAPLVKDQPYGSVNISLNGQLIQTIPVVALEDDPQGGILTRGWDHIALMVAKWFHRD